MDKNDKKTIGALAFFHPKQLFRISETAISSAFGAKTIKNHWSVGLFPPKQLFRLSETVISSAFGQKMIKKTLECLPSSSKTAISLKRNSNF